MSPKEAKEANEEYYLPLPAGTPYTVIAQATNTFKVKLSEREVKMPGIADGTQTPMAWILVGEKQELLKAEEFIINKMKEMLERFK